MVTRDISPYFILSNRKPTGLEGSLSNSYVKENYLWEYGTLNDAVNFAVNYMKESVTPKKWVGERI